MKLGIIEPGYAGKTLGKYFLSIGHDCGDLDGYKKTVAHFALRYQQGGRNKW